MKVLAVTLTKFTGPLKLIDCELSVAETLDDGLARIRSSPADLVILDRDMAGPDWRPAIRQFSSEPNCGCVILASRVVDDYLWEEVVQNGGFDVTVMPFQQQEVAHAIEFARPHRKTN